MSEKAFAFKSLANPDKTGFEFTSEWGRWFGGREGSDHAGSHFGFFETLGDGMTKHSPSMPVRRHQLEDLFYSLAAHLLETPGDYHYRMASTFEHHLDAKEVSFLIGFNGKSEFYSMREMKESNADKCQHDRRWFKTPRFNGSEAGHGPAWKAVRIYTNAHEGLFFWRDLLSEISVKSDLAEKDDYGTQEFVELDRGIFTAWRFIQKLVEAFTTIHNGKDQVRCYQRNQALRRELEMKPTEVAA